MTCGQKSTVRNRYYNFCSPAKRAKRKLRAMKTKILFVAALALAHGTPAQTPSPVARQSGQLGQSFEPTLSQSSSTSADPVRTPASASNSAAATVQTVPAAPSNPAASKSISVQTSRDRKSRSAISYVEGSIWMLTFIKTKSGLTDDYFKSISASLKPVYEEEKKQKMILDYKILSADASDERDFNVIIMVEYPNTASLAGSRERIEPIIDKFIGSAEARRDLATKRSDIREILATKTMHEIWLK